MKYLLILITLLLPLSSKDEPIAKQRDVLEIVIPNKEVKKKRGFCCRHIGKKEYMGYELQTTNVNTNISPKLVEFLEELKVVSATTFVITSLKRSSNNKSKHNIGLAVDFELTKELVNFLISEAGQELITKYNATVYIEDKPGSKLLKQFTTNLTNKYIFYNPGATGPHIHINI
jgi:hypothetical protein